MFYPPGVCGQTQCLSHHPWWLSRNRWDFNPKTLVYWFNWSCPLNIEYHPVNLVLCWIHHSHYDPLIQGSLCILCSGIELILFKSFDFLHFRMLEPYSQQHFWQLSFAIAGEVTISTSITSLDPLRRYGLNDEQLQELLGRAGVEPNGLAFTVGPVGELVFLWAGDGWNPRHFGLFYSHFV